MSSEDLLGALLGHTVGQREFETGLDQLLNVRALDIGSLLNFDNLENLYKVVLERLCEVVQGSE